MKSQTKLNLVNPRKLIFPLVLIFVGLVLLTSCQATPSSLNPFSWFEGGDDGGSDTKPDPNTPAGQTSAVLDALVRFGWFGLILLMFIPQVRAPFIALWTAIFRALAIPFELAHIKFNIWAANKYPDRYVLVSQLEEDALQEDHAGD